MDGAVTPTSLPGMVATPIPHVPNEAEKARIQTEQEKAELTLHPGWTHFVEGYRRQILALRTLQGVDFKGMSYEEIGQRTMAAHLAADTMQSELTKMEETARAVHSRNARKKPIDA